MVASILHLGATATGVTGIFAILLTLNHPVKYIISMAVAMGVAFTLTWLFGTNNEQIKNENKPSENKTEKAENADVADDGIITAPLSGKA